MSLNRKRGDAAEELVAREYVRRGAVILARNYAIRGGELDIVARQGDTVAFVEVKYRSGGAYGSALEAVTPVKQRRVCRAAKAYAYEHELLDSPMRFDIAALSPDGMTIIENAFDFVDYDGDW